MPSTDKHDSTQVSVGDLVVVLKGCCDRAMQGVVGVHATVLRFYDDPNRLCCFCESPIPTKRAELDHPKWNCPVPWLKRIPPLAEPERERHDEEITA
jgi:hypothetical protein